MDQPTKEKVDALLHEHVTMLENILEKAAEGICVCHNIPDEPYVRFTHWNPRMTQITGYTMEEINQLNWYRAMYPDPEARKKAVDRMARMRKGDDIHAEEWEVTAKGGEKKPLSISTSIITEKDGRIHVLAIIQDISQRKKAEESLRRSEEKYRELFEQGSDLLCVHDLEGNFIQTNVAFNKACGRNPDELVNMNLRDLVPERYRHQIADYLVRITEKGNDDSFLRVRIKNGGEIVIEYNNILISNETGPVYVQGSGKDVTERLKNERALKESEEKYRTILDNIEDGYYEVDLAGNFTFFNNSMCKILGYSSSELMGMNNRAYSDRENARKVFQAFNRIFTTGKPSRALGWEFIKKDGTKCYVDTSISLIRDPDGNAKGFRGIARDITGRKTAEEELKKSREQYREVVENANDAIIILQDGQIVFNNQRTETLTGYSKEELAEIPFINFIIPDDRDAFLERYLKKLNGEQFGTAYAFRVMNKNGQKLCVEANAVLISWQGKPAAQCFIRDVTLQKKMEDQLRQAHKLEAIGTLAGGIAHDFNNILSIVLGNTELAMLDIPDWNPARKNLEESRKACFRASDVVRQILSFSRQTEQERKPIDLGSIIKESLKLLRASIPAGIEIRPNIPDVSNVIIADPAQIHQVIINLCANAAHAMKEKGDVIEVSLMETTLDEHAAPQYSELAPGLYLQLSVRDTGHGIDPKIIDRIFDPYFTTKKIGEGSGMGLAVVHGIVKNNGGAITVYSEPGNGTIFRILFPKTDTELVPEKETTEKPPGGKEQILYVDDEISLAEVGKKMLEHLGYRVESKTKPIDALEMFRADPHGFDLVITDMAMPQMTGKVLAQELIRIRPDIPIILNTGYSDQIDETQAKELGIRAYIMKPLNMMLLAKTVRRILDNQIP